MTLETFLEKLEQTPRDWELLAGTRIRRPGCICPIVELSGLHKEGYSICAAALELSNELRDTIVASADNSRTGFYGPFDPELRAKLLKACGLESA